MCAPHLRGEEGNVLLGNRHSCGHYFDTYHLSKQCCSPSNSPSWQQYSLVSLFQQDNEPCDTANTVQLWFEEKEKPTLSNAQVLLLNQMVKLR